MAKINFKFSYGQKVITPISNRCGSIEECRCYTDQGTKRYLVAIGFAYETSDRFRQIREVFDENELRAID